MRTLCSLLLVLAACKGSASTPPPSEPTPRTPTPVPSTPAPSTPTPPPVDGDGDGFAEDVDCDDGDPDVHPEAHELCNGIDDDCSGTPDDGLTFLDYFPDHDADGYGAGTATSSCEPVAGAVTDDHDCNDADATVHPAAAEVCNGIDDDCSGTPDDGLTFLDYFPDHDADGYGDDQASATPACAPVAGMVTDGTDCDDADATVNPGAIEICNQVDDDCTDGIDNGATSAFSVDLDLDGYGALVQACTDPDGDGDELPGDCDDDDSTAHPGAEDLCNGVDNDCSGDSEHLIPADFAEVSEAIAAASAGDSLCIGPGTYGPAVIDKDLKLVGAGSDQVAIDGGSTSRTLEVASGVVQVEIRGVTLQNGDAPTGAGLRINEPTGSVTLDELVITDNHCGAASCAGVGIWFTGELTMHDVHLEDNHADLPGDGNLTGVGIYGENGTLLMTDSEVVGSVGTCQGSIWIDGGGMHLNEVDAVITDSELRENSLIGGQTRAHAIGAYGSSATLVLERVRIEGNTAYGDTWPYPAKGVIQLGVDAEIRNTVIAGNDVDAESGSILGNVLTTFNNATVTVEHSTIADNTADSLAPWGAVLDGNGATVSFSHVILSNNAGNAMVYSSGGTTLFDHTLTWASGNLPTGFDTEVSNQVEVEPMFADPVHGDYHLAAGSPAIDAGDPNIEDTDGSVADLGAHGGPQAD